jgi:hypothetical protein
VGSIRDSNAREGLSLSFRKMEKARKARMTTPPTVPPTMRIVLVLELVEEVEVEDSAVAEEVEEEDVVGEPAEVAPLSGSLVVVGLGSKLGVVTALLEVVVTTWAC